MEIKNKKRIILFIAASCLVTGLFFTIDKTEASLICDKEKKQQRIFKNETNRRLYWKMYWIQNHKLRAYQYFKNFCQGYDSRDKNSLRGLSAYMQKMCWQYLMFAEYADYLDYKKKCHDEDDDADTYTLTYNAGEHGAITGISPQTVNKGGSGSAVTAVEGVPDPDCPPCWWGFVRWSDGSTDNPRTDTNVTRDINVTAEWAAYF